MDSNGHWRILVTKEARGSYNLALDEALFRLAVEGKGPPTIRFYGWSPPALSVGYFQSWQREIDEKACAGKGISVYRRITGGRAVLHDREVTYSVVSRAGSPLFSAGLVPAYRAIGTALASGLGRLGVGAELVRPAPPGGGKAVPRHPSCFSSASGYEIASRGKKLVGSAQKRRGGAILQHGSILLAVEDGGFESLLRHPPPGGPAPSGGLTSLEALLGRFPEREEVVEALSEGFRESWGISLIPGGLTGEEERLSEELERRKYLSLLWNGPEKKEPELEIYPLSR